MILTFKYRLLPTRAQHAALAKVLEDQRHLYNAALQERIEAWGKAGETRTYMDQCKGLSEWRQADVEAAATPSNLHRWTLKRVDDAYKAFFRRVKKSSGKAGFPRFRGMGWWKSFGFREFSGIRLVGNRLAWKSLPGTLRMHMHRKLPDGKPLSCTFTRDGKGWHVCLQMRTEPAARRRPVASVGIDVGLSSLAALSTGELIPNPRHAKHVEREMRRRQRHMARCKRGSSGRRKAREQLARLHRKVVATRGTALHQVSASLVRRFDVIAVEKLNLKGLASGMLAKSVHDASWGKLRQMLAYKAERAGCELIEVDPRYTSQTCPDCGQVAAKSLSQRIHQCDCGCKMDRDVAAARVILGRAVVGPGALNVAGCGERALGNITLEGIPR